MASDKINLQCQQALIGGNAQVINSNFDGSVKDADRHPTRFG